MSITTQLLNALQSFIVYFVELSVLFLALNMFVSCLNARFSGTIQKHLHKKGIASYLKAMLLGAMTPFCSCSTIPLFIAFLRNKIPLSVSFAYLMTSPLINPIILVMLLVSFGINLTLAYIIFVMLVIVLFSFYIESLNQETLLKASFFTQNNPKISCCTDFKINFPAQNAIKFSTQIPNLVQNNLQKTQSCCTKPKKETESKSCCTDSKNPSQSLKSYFYASFRDYKKLLPYLIVGMGIGAFIHDFIPQGSLESFLKDFGYLGVVIAAFVALLLYIRVEAIIPIGLGFINAGVPLGMVMSLLIAGGGCSLPELILLKSIFTMRFLLLFILIVLSIAIGFGSFVLAFGL
ncbi:permease [Helicobacter sp. MIT 11-5569]|uniref:permease n=1 Tax=Helicobacter sp. MIT 11-5569 TaxID=1548151 RepID=UPI00051FF0CB|nr:permease [Helicobacter sp. MIT 11-5569]